MGVTVSKADVGKHGWASRGGMLAKQGAGRGQICSFVHCRGRDSLYRVLNHMRMTTATQSSEKTIDGGVEQMLLSSQVIVWVGWVLGDGK